MKRLCVFLLLFVFSLSIFILPVMAADPSPEVEQLKKDMQRLLDEQMILKNRIEDLEKTQIQTETKTIEAGKKVVEAEKKGIQAGYDKGFYIKTPDDNFFLKTNLFLQFRYTDLDGKEDSRKWPGGNANFQVNNEDTVTKYPVGGFHLFRSQGVQLQGDIDMFGQNGFLQYWAGVYNGRNTKGGINLDSSPIWVGRISVNPFGKYNLLQQGDIDYSKTPKVCFLVSGFHNTDRLSQTRSSTGGTVTVDPYDVKGSGYDLAALFRYKGFSADAEYGYDRLEQDREDGNTWDRFAYRFDAGYFLISKKFEVVARYAYVERLEDNNVEKSLSSGLGLVSVNGGTNNAIEDNLQEYTVGLNYYFYGHNLKFFVDYSYLTREFIEVPGSTVS